MSVHASPCEGVMTSELQAFAKAARRIPSPGLAAKLHLPSSTGTRRVNKGSNHGSHRSVRNLKTRITLTPLCMHLCTFMQKQTIAAASAERRRNSSRRATCSSILVTNPESTSVVWREHILTRAGTLRMTCTTMAA